MSDPKRLRSVQLIALDLALRLCAKEPRMLLSYFYIKAKSVFDIWERENGNVFEMIFDEKDHDSKIMEIWKKLYELANITEEDDPCNAISILADEFSTLGERTGQEPVVDCLRLSRKSQCFKKILKLVKSHKTYPPEIVLQPDFVCPLLSNHKTMLCDGTCGYGYLCYEYKYKFEERTLPQVCLPRPEYVIYKYLHTSVE